MDYPTSFLRKQESRGLVEGCGVLCGEVGPTGNWTPAFAGETEGLAPQSIGLMTTFGVERIKCDSPAATPPVASSKKVSERVFVASAKKVFVR